MSSKKLGGLDRKLSSKRLKLKVPGGGGGSKAHKVLGALGVGPILGPVNPYSMDPEVIGARAGETGTSSVARDEELATEGAAAEVLAQQQAATAEAAAKQKVIDDRLAQEEEARRKLRESSGGGYASTVLTGAGGLTTSAGAAGRRLYGS